MKTKHLLIGIAALTIAGHAATAFAAEPTTITLEDFNKQVRSTLHQGNVTQAIQLLTSAIQVNPTDVDLYLERAAVYVAIHDPKSALADCNQVISIDPTDCRGYQGRADVEALMNDGRDSIQDATEAVQLHPSMSTYLVRALCYLHKHQADEAIADCDSALKLAPNAAAPYYVRGIANLSAKRHDDAIKDATAAISLKPESVLYVLRAVAWYRKGEYQKTRDDFNSSLTQPHRTSWGLNDAAFFYAASPDTSLRDAQKAVDCAAEACDRTGWRNLKYIDTYAAACAEAGDFELAAQCETECLGDQHAPPGVLKAYAARLALYKAGKTYQMPR